MKCKKFFKAFSLVLSLLAHVGTGKQQKNLKPAVVLSIIFYPKILRRNTMKLSKLST